jgi:hypothetical protein
MLLAYVAETAILWRRNARTTDLGPALRQLGVYAGESAISIAGDKNGIVAAADILATVDLRSARVVHSTTLRDAVGLKIYEGSSDTIGFRILLKNGAESRRIETRSVVDFAKLFVRMTHAGKRIQYIQE